MFADDKTHQIKNSENLKAMLRTAERGTRIYDIQWRINRSWILPREDFQDTIQFGC